MLVRPVARSPRRRADASDTSAVTVVVDVAGWVDDAVRALAALPPEMEAIAIDRSGGDGSWAPEARPGLVLLADPATGFGRSVNEGVFRAGGAVVVVIDPSLEATGDLLGPLAATLDDPGVAVAGPFGLVTADLREYAECLGPDAPVPVTAVQGYALAARRSDLLAVGGMRESFSWYRNADIDLSLRLRVGGAGSPRRAVAVGSERCVRHEHRAWAALDPAERESASRRNMKRVLDKFGDRTDLAVL